MELCEGGELFDRIVARGHYTERAAAVVTRTIVEVVQRFLLEISFDRFNGFLGLPVEFELEIPCRVPSASTSVFGVSAELMQCAYDSKGNSVPTILLLMQERLYAQDGLKAEGIFRINAENGQEEHVREQLNNGIVPVDIDVHCLAELTKRQLPLPLHLKGEVRDGAPGEVDAPSGRGGSGQPQQVLRGPRRLELGADAAHGSAEHRAVPAPPSPPQCLESHCLKGLHLHIKLQIRYKEKGEH